MPQDERQFEFPFVLAVAKPEVEKVASMFKTSIWDCASGRHQMLPNGTCQLCRKQVEHV